MVINGKDKMVKITVAIDPGKLGAIAYFVDGEFQEVIEVPLIKKDVIDKIALKELLKPENIVMKYVPLEEGYTLHYHIEAVKVNWMGGKKQVADARGNIEFILGLLTAFEHPYIEILPAHWQKYCWQGVTLVKNSDDKTDTKSTSFLALQRLFPNVIERVRIKRKPYFHDGLVDAILIGYYATKN